MFGKVVSCDRLGRNRQWNVVYYCEFQKKIVLLLCVQMKLRALILPATTIITVAIQTTACPPGFLLVVHWLPRNAIEITTFVPLTKSPSLHKVSSCRKKGVDVFTT